MTRRSPTLLLRIGLVWLASAGLSGCNIGSAEGNVWGRPVASAGQVAETATLASRAKASRCSVTGSTFDCIYIVDGQTAESHVVIVSEQWQVRELEDPLILEVPAGVFNATGTYDTGSGPQPLPINRVNSFPVQPGMRITAEVGTTFLIFDLPIRVTSGLPISNPTAGPVFSYTLAFLLNVPPGPPQDLKVKPMLAGAVTVLWQTYYVPLLPCVTDFASIPAVTIPQSNTPQNLTTSLGDILRAHTAGPCNHAVYDFTLAMPPVGLLFLPLIQR